MSTLTQQKLAVLRGGGCMKWIRRYNRAVKAGIDDENYLRDMIWAFEECVANQYQ